MARRLATILLLVAALTLPSAARPCNAPAPDAAERERVVDYARSLETHPLAKDNLQKRMWLTEWIVNTPAMKVTPCCEELNSLDEINNTYSQQLRMQALYSQAAYQIEHPEVTDQAAIQAAGLAGTLRAYRAIQRFDPSARYPLLDDLMSIEKKGKLQRYVERRTRCIEE